MQGMPTIRGQLQTKLYTHNVAVYELAEGFLFHAFNTTAISSTLPYNATSLLSISKASKNVHQHSICDTMHRRQIVLLRFGCCILHWRLPN